MKLAFDKLGASGTTVTILHGLFGSGRNWRQIGQSLAQRHEVLLPTLRNHGDSPHGPHSIALMCDDVLRFLHENSNRHTHLVGHSLGGLVAMRFAAANPKCVRSLTVVDIAPEARLDRLNFIFEALLALPLDNLSSRTDADKRLALAIPDTVVRQFLLQNLRRDADGCYRWRTNLEELYRFVQREPIFSLAEAERFDGPTLFIGGGRSEVRLDSQTQLIRRHFPHSRLAMIPQAGHWPHFDAREPFLGLLDGFLD